MSDTVALAFIALVQICMLALLARISQRQGNCGDTICKATVTRIDRKALD